MNIPFFLRCREMFGLSRNDNRLTLWSGIRKYRLRDLLPVGRLSEIFLGFAADGRFLISYTLQSDQFWLRFWLIPSNHKGTKGALKHPFAQFSLEKCPSCFSFLSTLFSIRFLQSINDPQNCVILFSHAIGRNVSMIWGSMPEPDCVHCRDVASQLSVNETPTKCPYHMQLFRLYPDHQPFSEDMKSGIFGIDTDESEERFKTRVFNLPVPSCFLPLAQSPKPCECFQNATGLLQPSVCPETGRLRVAWVSQGGQIRVVSCSLSSGEEKALVCNLPSGSYHELRRQGSGRTGKMSASATVTPPLAYQSPLLTSNYCSTCFFWPSDTSCCRIFPSVFSPSTRLSSIDTASNNVSLSSPSRCIFSASSSIRRVLPNETWPDGHRHQILPESNYLRRHKCARSYPTNTWNPSLLTSKGKIFSCSPVSYLAMLQDIRASYIHWALIPNETESGNENGHQEERENDDPNARSIHSFVDTSNNPEINLANQLCGQCHSYFESTDWHEAPVDECGRLNASSLTKASHVIAHMEEVVFDLPEVNQNSCTIAERILFTSPLEPDWLLVYESDQSLPVPHLVAVIDLASGMQRDPDEAQYFSRLASMTSQCPSFLRFSASPKQFLQLPHGASRAVVVSSTLLELNNYGAYAHGESLSQLVDPQGGYVFYL